MLKLDDGTLPTSSLNLYNANGSTPPQFSGLASSTANDLPKSEALQSGKQISEVMYFFSLSIIYNYISMFLVNIDALANF